jgi:hypothetical protein
MHPRYLLRALARVAFGGTSASAGATVNASDSHTRSDATRTACGLILGLFGVALIGFSQTAGAQDQPIVNVSTVAQLYAAVNDPENADTLIVLAPGIYALSGTAPNQGSLVLQPHMGLAGYNEYADVDGDGVWDEVDWPAEDGFPATRAFARPKTETIIDGTRLTINSGVIRVGVLRWAAGSRQRGQWIDR